MSNPAILIVEDEAIVSADIADMIRKLGYEVAGVTSTGEEAVRIASKQPLSLVLMDIRLAGEIDGVEAAEIIRRKCQVPVIFLTALSDKTTLKRSLQAHAFGYIMKPFDDRELHMQIEMALYKYATEQHLRESESRLREVLENSLDVSYNRNLQTRDYDYLSPVILRITGYTPEEMKRFTIEAMKELIHPNDRADVERALSRSISGDSGSAYHMEYRFRHKQGHYIWLHNQFTLIRDASGLPLASIGVIRDITSRKQAEEEKIKLEAQNIQLQKSESLGRMAGAIAHHFNNQFHVAMGNLEIAMNDLSLGKNPDGKLVSAMKAIQKAAKVSSQMLTYLGQAPGKRELIDLSEACRQSLPLLQAAVPKGTIIKADFPSIGPSIHANSGQIQHILVNLITNAWESADENRRGIGLTVKTVSRSDIPASMKFPIGWQPIDSDYACLEVADAGCGIAKRDIEKIFDPFFTTKFTGRGLGLSVVLGIVRAHLGAVTVESKPGKGCIFRVFIPVSSEEVSHKPVNFIQVPKGDESSIILLVEDEKMVRKMTADMLKEIGFRVFEANDGVEAVTVYQQHQDEIRCVLTDLTMPRMGGWETLDALRKISPEIPVILSSGYDEDHVMSGDHPERPNAFLGKPYRLQELKDAIRHSLALKENSITQGLNAQQADKQQKNALANFTKHANIPSYLKGGCQ